MNIMLAIYESKIMVYNVAVDDDCCCPSAAGDAHSHLSFFGIGRSRYSLC